MIGRPSRITATVCILIGVLVTLASGASVLSFLGPWSLPTYLRALLWIYETSILLITSADGKQYDVVEELLLQPHDPDDIHNWQLTRGRGMWNCISLTPCQQELRMFSKKQKRKEERNGSWFWETTKKRGKNMPVKRCKNPCLQWKMGQCWYWWWWWYWKATFIAPDMCQVEYTSLPLILDFLKENVLWLVCSARRTKETWSRATSADSQTQVISKLPS